MFSKTRYGVLILVILFVGIGMSATPIQEVNATIYPEYSMVLTIPLEAGLPATIGHISVDGLGLI